MSNIALYLGLKVFIKSNLAADFREDCTISGQVVSQCGGLVQWNSDLSDFAHRGERVVLMRGPFRH